ncbi:MAG: hypothetical protein BWZ03_00697 [bacterium ADurb.BinA186]|nr:MAG: hypothetical protein BWZ03_00697 [bacterium ADurb.BinA186]
MTKILPMPKATPPIAAIRKKAITIAEPLDFAEGKPLDLMSTPSLGSKYKDVNQFLFVFLTFDFLILS